MGQAAREGAGRLANSGGPPRLKLGPDAVASALRSVPDWRRNGDAICRTFVFKDFPAAMKFVEAVAGIAEREWHHPDILVQWNKVTLTLTTHDAGGLTDRDFALASMFDLSANERQ
ncbi:MAG: 4a-hydroxytetrahydrobiopterin dehydratase [Verrucomicrobia bacterium]|nr:4a-hydroxytetrahydrobiopterin dehydratase [Verrucomicrobiota bacterium]MDE3099664.1 4a-hydroxytetrahydrobiopterin dehydratase [Verrucomicrobiota bacterium]